MERVAQASRRAAALLLLTALAGCGERGARDALHFEGKAFGTTWSAQLVLAEIETPDASRVAALRATIDAVLERVDRGMSSWRQDAEIARFNRDSGPSPVAFSPEARRVVSAALEMARETDGAFDPTVGPLVALWGFGPEAASDAPSEAQLVRARARVGWRRLAWDETGRLVRRVPGVELDLSAIAKGYAVDAVFAELGAAHPSGLLVEIGGEVRAAGVKADGAPWRVGIQRPTSEGLEEVVALGGGALATSGDYRQTRRVEGQRISHVIDPRTGRSAHLGVASASVIAPTCMEADAVATALMVLGPDAGLAWIEQRPWLEALLLVRADDGALERRASSGWGHWEPRER